jgi:hypothetical protein
MDMVANDLPGNMYTMHSAAGTNLVDAPDRITNSVMIEIDPVFQMCSMIIVGVINFFKEITSEKNSKFAQIDFVIFITFAGYQFVASWLRDNKFIDYLIEVAK